MWIRTSRSSIEKSLSRLPAFGFRFSFSLPPPATFLPPPSTLRLPPSTQDLDASQHLVRHCLGHMFEGVGLGVGVGSGSGFRFRFRLRVRLGWRLCRAPAHIRRLTADHRQFDPSRGRASRQTAGTRPTPPNGRQLCIGRQLCTGRQLSAALATQRLLGLVQEVVREGERDGPGVVWRRSAPFSSLPRSRQPGGVWVRVREGGRESARERASDRATTAPKNKATSCRAKRRSSPET